MPDSAYQMNNESSIGKILSFLKRLLTSNGFVEDFLERSFKAVTPEVLELWVSNNINLLPETTKKLYFEHPMIKPVFKTLVGRHWPLIQHYLGHPDRAVEKLVEYHPENRTILESQEARRYLEKQIKNAYELFCGLRHDHGSHAHHPKRFED